VIDAYLLDVTMDENTHMVDAARSHRVNQPDLELRTGELPDMSRSAEGRWGSREAEITGVELRRADGVPALVFTSGDPVDVVIRVAAHQPLSDFVFGVGIFNADGVCCYGTNTHIEGGQPAELSGDAEVTFRVGRLDLVEGAYKLDVAVHRQNGAPYDYHRQLYAFRVTSRTRDVGVFRPPHEWTFSGGVRMTGL
jgi:hypothetical protein